MPFEIESFRPHRQSTLLGFSTFRMTGVGLEIRGVTVQENDGKRSIGLTAKLCAKSDVTQARSYVVAFYNNERWVQSRKQPLKILEPHLLPTDFGGVPDEIPF